MLSATEWQTLQRIQFEALDSITPERLQGTKPSGWSVVTDSYSILDNVQALLVGLIGGINARHQALLIEIHNDGHDFHGRRRGLEVSFFFIFLF